MFDNTKVKLIIYLVQSHFLSFSPSLGGKSKKLKAFQFGEKCTKIYCIPGQPSMVKRVQFGERFAVWRKL